MLMCSHHSAWRLPAVKACLAVHFLVGSSGSSNSIMDLEDSTRADGFVGLISIGSYDFALQRIKGFQECSGARECGHMFLSEPRCVTGALGPFPVSR